jgi:hypothetical protein
MPKLQQLALILALLTLSACGGLQKAAVTTTGALIYDASKEIETETNWEFFKQAVPANLKFMEGLHYVEPNNQDLLVSLVKGYTGYAYGVSETLALEEKLSDKGRRFHQQALAQYSRAIKYALAYLSEEGLSYKKLQRAVRSDGGLPNLLENHLDSDDQRDRELVAFAAQAFAGYINLRRDEMSIIAQLPVAKAMFDWVCEAEPEINYGACDIFFAVYEAGRPKSLGGNPEKGEKLFMQALEKYPHNWLVRLTYVQYVVLPQKNKESYKKQKAYMKDWPELMKKNENWKPFGEKPKDFEVEGLGVYQSLALKRYEIIKNYEDKIFE